MTQKLRNELIVYFSSRLEDARVSPTIRFEIGTLEHALKVLDQDTMAVVGALVCDMTNRGLSPATQTRATELRGQLLDELHPEP
jgi:hypothetical protein